MPRALALAVALAASFATGGPAEAASPSARIGPPAPDARAVRIAFDSRPAGATVTEDAVVICAATPCEVTYRGEDADPSREHTVVFAKPGFQPKPAFFFVTDASVKVVLSRRPAVRTAAVP